MSKKATIIESESIVQRNSFANFVIEEDSLRADKFIQTVKIVSVFNVETQKTRKESEEVIDIEEKTVYFPFKSVTKEELSFYRKLGKPGFVFKKEGKLFYAEIEKEVNMFSVKLFGEHRCAPANDSVCQRLSAAVDEKGGCKKVRDIYKCLEDYDWIVEAYQTFNTQMNCFHVLKCNNYERCTPKKSLPIEEINQKKLALAQFFFEDIITLGEVNLKKLNSKERFY